MISHNVYQNRTGVELSCLPHSNSGNIFGTEWFVSFLSQSGELNGFCVVSQPEWRATSTYKTMIITIVASLLCYFGIAGSKCHYQANLVEKNELLHMIGNFTTM
uniref:U3 small nucleolar ribonucleoprotein protein mpp10 n=1 Tax=Solanum tuberosum TaxID=4113 RepID=M1BJC1_SOLTU